MKHETVIGFNDDKFLFPRGEENAYFMVNRKNLPYTSIDNKEAEAAENLYDDI